MKALLVGEYREGRLLESTYELIGFANKIGAEFELFLVGSQDQLPQVDAKVYLADVAAAGEYNPSLHKQLILDASDKAGAETIVFIHSSYGWDLAPRVALALNAAQVSEVVETSADGYLLPACNAKLRRSVSSARVSAEDSACEPSRCAIAAAGSPAARSTSARLCSAKPSTWAESISTPIWRALS